MGSPWGRISKRLFSTDDPALKFDLALGKTLLFIPLSLIFLFIPLLGWVLAFTLGPYLGGRIGGKHVAQRDGIIVGVMAGAIWSAIQVYIIIRIMDIIATVKIGGWELLIIILIFALNCLFCALGGWTGGTSRATLEEKVSREQCED